MTELKIVGVEPVAGNTQSERGCHIDRSRPWM